MWGKGLFPVLAAGLVALVPAALHATTLKSSRFRGSGSSYCRSTSLPFMEAVPSRPGRIPLTQKKQRATGCNAISLFFMPPLSGLPSRNKPGLGLRTINPRGDSVCK